MPVATAEALIKILGEDRVSQIVDGIQKKFDKAAESTKEHASLTQTVKAGWASVATGVASVFTIAEKVIDIVGGIGDALREAAAEQALERNFKNAFSTAKMGVEALSAALEEATGGQIEGDVYQQIASKAKVAGLATEEIIKLMRLATQAANASGRDVEEVAAGLVKDITTGKDATAKSLGVNVDLKRIYVEQAALLGVKVSELDKATKQTAQWRAEADALAVAYGHVDVSDTALAKTSQLAVLWGDIKDAVKSSGLMLVDTDFLTDATASAVDLVTFGLAGAQDGIEKTRNQMALLAFEEQKLANLAERRKRAAADSFTDSDFNKRARAEEAIWNHAKALEAEITKERDAKVAAAEHAKELANTAWAMGNATAEAKYLADAARLTAEANGQKLTPSIKETYWALRTQQFDLANSADAMAFYALSIGDVTTATNKWKEAAAIRGALAGKPTKGGGGGGGRGARDEAQDRLDDIMAANPYKLSEEERKLIVDGRWERAKAETDAERDIEARRIALQKTKIASMEGASRSLGEMIKASTMTGFAGANQALASGSEQYLVGIAAFADGLQSEHARIQQILALTEQAGGTQGQAWQKAAPGMISASGKMLGAFVKDAKIQYSILAAAEGAASLMAFATPGMQWSGVLHAAAAIQYGLAAAMAGGSGASKGSGGGGGGGRGASSARTGQLPGAAPAAAPLQPVTINLSFAGANMFADDPKTYQMIAYGIGKHVGRYGGGSGAPV